MEFIAIVGTLLGIGAFFGLKPRHLPFIIGGIVVIIGYNLLIDYFEIESLFLIMALPFLPLAVLLAIGFFKRY
jgi:hypothetical protein